jgi:hypothetical protein
VARGSRGASGRGTPRLPCDRGQSWSAGDPVEEAEDGGDLAFLVGDRDIEADDLRLGPRGTKAPGEARR